MTLEGAQLGGLRAIGVQQAQIVKERFDLERRVTFELGLAPRLILCKGIGKF